MKTVGILLVMVFGCMADSEGVWFWVAAAGVALGILLAAAQTVLEVMHDAGSRSLLR